MFRVNVDGRVYGVRFQYSVVALVGDRHERHFGNVFPVPDVDNQSTRTTCQILLLDDEARTHEIAAAGFVDCDHRDKYDKDKGRFLAFEKAIQDLRAVYETTKAERKLFFDAYFENHKHKRHIIERRVK